MGKRNGREEKKSLKDETDENNEGEKNKTSPRWEKTFNMEDETERRKEGRKRETEEKRRKEMMEKKQTEREREKRGEEMKKGVIKGKEVMIGERKEE